MKLSTITIPLLAAVLLSGCGGDDDNDHDSSSSSSSSSSSIMSSSSESSSSESSSSMASMMEIKYSVTITNLTAGQPFSPTAYVLHTPGYAAFSVGMPASVGVEKIAESGAYDDFVMAAAEAPTTLISGAADGGAMPGDTLTLMMSAMVNEAHASQVALTLVGMLGNTNDAFMGVDGVNVGELAVGDSMTINPIAYDAGTEANSETAATVPGPAAEGEGFNAERDDNADMVTAHPGVITSDDGKTDSALTHLQRWDNPVSRITITRMALE